MDPLGVIVVSWRAMTTWPLSLARPKIRELSDRTGWAGAEGTYCDTYCSQMPILLDLGSRKGLEDVCSDEWDINISSTPMHMFACTIT